MGLLQQVVGPAAQHFDKLGTASQVAVVFFGLILLSVILNVLNQIFNKNPNEPPVVFHWLPFIGSTVIYGMDPPTFFKENSEKVRPPPPKSLHNALSCRLPPTNPDKFHSTAMSSPSFSSARRPPSTLVPTETSLS